MQTAAIVLISVLGGILFVILIAGIAAMIVLHLRTQRKFAELQVSMADFSSESKTLIEGARSSFTGIRQDIKTAQETQGRALTKTLKDHEAAFRETMGKLNGDALLRASVENMRAVREMTALAITLKNVLADHEAPAAMTDLGPEEYAPSDTIYGTRSTTARLDDMEVASEAAESEPLYSSGAAE